MVSDNSILITYPNHSLLYQFRPWHYAESYLAKLGTDFLKQILLASYAWMEFISCAM